MLRYDPLTKAERSERMSHIRSTNTKPEMIIRRLVHGLGYRYRLYANDLPGNPDLVFRRSKRVIFVHGCLWHQHSCRRYRQPRSNRTFWETNLARNKIRDSEVRKMLREKGWEVLIVWECQLGHTLELQKRIRHFLER